MPFSREYFIVWGLSVLLKYSFVAVAVDPLQNFDFPLFNNFIWTAGPWPNLYYSRKHGDCSTLCFSERGCDVNITLQHRYQSCHTAVSTFVSRFVKASAVGKGKRKSNGVFECCHGDPPDALHISVKELLFVFSQNPWRLQLAWCCTPVCFLIGLFFSCGLLRIGTRAPATCAPLSCLIGSVVLRC